jgi:type I restriction enzyme, S subunit
LGDACDVIMGQSPPSSTYNTIGDGLPFFQGATDFGDVYPKTRIYCSAPARIAEKGDVLISVRAPVGPTNRAPAKSCIGRGVAALRPHPELDVLYLFYFLRHQEARLAYLGKGSTFDAIGRDDLEEYPIPLQPLPVQRRIAGILDKADRLRRMRRYALELSDQFLPALFLRMFGDRLDHPTKRQLRDDVTISGGGTPSRDRLDYYTGRIPWLTSKDMVGDYIWDTEEHITEEAIAESATKLVPAGSVLLVVKSKVLAHSLPVAIAKVPLCHGQDIKSIQCNAEMEPEFLRFLLKYNAPWLLRIARGANTEGLTLPMLNELPVPDVSVSEQRSFAGQVCLVEQERASQREALRQAEHLFQSLLNQYFGDIAWAARDRREVENAVF